MRNSRFILILAALAIGLPLTVVNAMAQSDTTGYRDMMEDIFSPVCLNCHNSELTSRNGAPSSVNYDTYTLAAENATRGNTRVQVGTMPPTGALSSAQMATFQAWVGQGTPLGTVVKYDDVRSQLFQPACVNCHSSTASNRSGAPTSVNFDTFAAARTSAVRGNSRAQDGTMPPFGTLTAAQKSVFQDWVWMDTPSGERVSYETLSDSLLQPALCIQCHSSFGTYSGAVDEVYALNNRIQTATTSPHGPLSQNLKDMMFNWIYAGLAENDVAPGPVCDLDGSGVVEITDAIWLILYMRNNPFDEAYDYNGDGRLSIGDVVSLVIAIRKGTCDDGGSLLASAAGTYTPPLWLTTLSQQDKKYAESMLALLGLNEQEEAAFHLALYGQSGRAALPRAFSLTQNSPNPFNPVTTISYTVPEGSGTRVTIEVFAISGRLVSVLADQFKEAGSYSVFWDGTNSSGAAVSSGVYFYRMRAGNFVQNRKMVLLK